MRVAVGITNENQFDTSSVKSLQVFLHEDYNDSTNNQNDIGLILLEKGIYEPLPKLPQSPKDDYMYKKRDDILKDKKAGEEIISPVAVGWGCR